MNTERHYTAEGVAYADEATHAAALALLDGWQFSLPKLDAFIEEWPGLTDDQRAQLLRQRGWMLDALADGDRRCVMFALLFFAEATRQFTHEAVLRPLAHKQAERHEKQAETQRRGAEAVRIYTAADHARWRELRHTEFAAHSKRRAADLICAREGLPESAAETVRKAL